MMKKRDLLLVFLIVFIPRCLLISQAYPFVYLSDETSAISVAALGAGYDWSRVVSNAGYYGIGYLFLFAPLFHLVKNPIYIYRIVLMISSMAVSASAPICYLVLSKFLKMENRGKKVIISSLCGLFHFFTVVQVNIRNEEILYLLIWIIVYVLCNILYCFYVDAKRKINEIVLLFLLIYSLTIHTRAVCLIIAVILFDMIGRVFLKKAFLHKWCYLIIAAGYMMTKLMLRWYQGKIWYGEATNASVISTVEGSLSRIMDFKNRNLYLNIIRIMGGQIYTATAVSGGLFIIAVIVLVIFFFKKNYKENEKAKYIFMIGGVFLFCTFLTIAGQSITWLAGVTNSMEKYGEGVYRDAYRAFTYLRYMGCYVSPCIMCALVIVTEDRKLLKKTFSYGMAVVSILTVFWIKMILPYIYNRKMLFFMCLGGMKADEKTLYENWYRACLLKLIILIVGLLLIHINKEYLYFSAVSLLLIFETVYVYKESTLVIEQNNYTRADAGYDLIQKMQSKKEIKEIYVFDGLYDLEQIFYLYQFLNYSVTIIPELPENMERDMILFSNEDLEDMLGESCYGAKLDNNEYVYCIGEENIALIENCGTDVQKWR